ncbi:MAG TPA: DsrE/DsrF/DrsH-like family protein [Candidatus Saccharicenans sp.]|nr:DsrE/DsrF/DrsH-like family protein [Candidatus Saccharicenans sp.]HQO75922.1 DsrE/DsrF/DrsH-like family protein [Candidatus Saccharicenans sp.]HUM79626.1 DsrE/DsrF/DrsH-like family protein [Candidatus Saccharicenans sp.]
MSEESAKRLAIIATHGTLDMAYPPFILSTAAVAMEMEAAIFFTFFGLEILKKGKIDKLKVSPVANPAMPMKIPNIIAMLPGMTPLATIMMNSWMRKAKVPKLSELLETALDMGVRLIGCQMTMDVMGVKKEDLIDGIEIGGAATFLEFASQNAITLSF